MTEKSVQLNETEQKIVKKYSKIHGFIFRYSIIIFVVIVSLLILNNQIPKTKKLNTTQDFIVEKAKLIGEFNKITNQSVNNEDIDIQILQGSLEMSGNFIFSTDNLILYKNITMPQSVFLYDITPIQDKSYFENGSYKIEDLENFAKNILFTNIDQIKTNKRIPISLPLDESIENTFYLGCTNDLKLLNLTCNHYIQNFIDTFFIYDLPRDYDGLKLIFDNLKNTEHKTAFCDGMKKYILYSNDTNEILENIFISCGDNYFQNFHTLQLFLDIQDQLQKGYINNTIYQNKILNNYKLISYQQILYNDIHENTINNIRFETYINYLQNLLKKNDKTDQFYIDLTYWFNNNYLINILNKFKYRSTDSKKLEIENIISSLNKLNNGDELIGYDGLKAKLANKDLQENKIFNIETETNISAQDEINKLLQNIKSLSFFKIIKERISGDKIKVSGYFSIKTDEGYIPLYSSIILKNIEKELIIENIKINEYDELNKTLQNITNSENYTISQVYQYIQENINIFMSSDKISTCELIQNTINNILEGSKNISSLELLECSSENISILKDEQTEESKNKIYYKISMNNFNIEDIMISNRYIENEINKSLPQINTNNITIANMVGEIISYQIEQTEYIQQGSNNIIITIEDFQKYLNIIPNDIVEGENKIILEFSIQGNNFIGNYNTSSKKLGPINFKYNEKNDEDKENIINKSDLEISNFELYLTENNQNNINKFSINPLEYLQSINPSAVSNYEKLKYK